MAVDRVKFQDVVTTQLPRYVREDFPLLADFLQQYYVSQEYQGGTVDLIQNIDQYVKLDQLCNLKTTTVLGQNIGFTSTTINAGSNGNWTDGFPENNGLIQIGDEIIRYDYKDDFKFYNCTRGFSGITSYIAPNEPDQLIFDTSEAEEHEEGDTIHNLNIIFLQEFLKKVKGQFTPGFGNRSLYSELDEKNFLFGADSFYSSKGTDSSFKILFNALYGKDVEVLHPSNFLLRPSDADYKVTRDFVVEQLQGDPLDLKNLTLFQKSTGAKGSVSNVRKVLYDTQTGAGSTTESIVEENALARYYQLSLDDNIQEGPALNDFIANPKTKLLTGVGAGATILDVDSTLGFPDRGILYVKDDNDDPITLEYDGKSVNQFFNVSGIGTNLTFDATADVSIDSYAYAISGGEEIQVRITSTLKDLKIDSKTNFYNADDTINIKSFGIEDQGIRASEWRSNTQAQWDVESISAIDVTETLYEIKTYDKLDLNPGYIATLKDNLGKSTTGRVVNINSAYGIDIILNSTVDVDLTYTVTNDLLKGDSTHFRQLNDFSANVQNSYTKFDKDVLVASNSIPRYNNILTNPDDKIATFSGTAIDNSTIVLTTAPADHGFYTGDAVYYEPSRTIRDGGQTITISGFENVDSTVYYIRRVNGQQVKLARSRSDLYAETYISLVGTVENNRLVYYDFWDKEVGPQALCREFSAPITKAGDFTTDPGHTGMLVNGVEILNYKSYEKIFYGDVKGIDITKGGEGYDVINPPLVNIKDDVGTGATAIAAVNGKLERIEIIDPGYDYQGTPKINIVGGNGTGASAEAKMASKIHSVKFNSEQGGDVSLNTTNTIGFSTFHKFVNAEKVVYNPFDLQSVAGLNTEAFYYVEVVDASTIKLHTTPANARTGINTVALSAYGKGRQQIQTAVRKSYVSSVLVTNSGSGYQNKQRTVPSGGISTSLNRVSIKDHGYLDKEIVQYRVGAGTTIVGLSTAENYYVHKVDNDTFSVSLVGTGVTSVDHYYDNNILVDLTSTGTGSFNYQPIAVTIDGVTGIGSTSGQTYTASIQPIFRGSLDSIDVTAGGVGYGASEVINFKKQPSTTFRGGAGGQISPVVANGKIVDVTIKSGGAEYNSPPDLVIKGSGSYAQLTPIVSNGVIESVKIINGGVGYLADDTTITVKAAGENAETEADLKEWRINLFQRNLETFKDDDGTLSRNINNTSLEYGHLYAPRPLRKDSYTLSGTEIQYGTPDLIVDDGEEVTQTEYHSPLIGWAYDGNPIYGPYGYSGIEGGRVAQMTSGYEINSTVTQRPPLSLYPQGFFIEDYIFTGSGDLDKHNGRFCVTPHYPKGTYAYFATFNSPLDTDGPFDNYKRPAFPYLIGDSYQSEPNTFNFKSASNQNEYDIESHEWFRNTSSYHISDARSRYNYIFNSNDTRLQTVDVTAASTGNIDNIGIVTGGTNYQPGDKVNFDNSGTHGSDANAQVDRVLGQTIDTVTCSTSSNYNVEFISQPGENKFIGFSSSPHSLLANDRVSVSGLNQYFDGFDGVYTIGVRTESYSLSVGVGTTGATGMTTYFYVSGELDYPSLRPNDILGIGTEKVKVLNIDKRSSRLRVLREQRGTEHSGLAYTSAEVLWEDPRKFSINVGSLKTTKSLPINNQLYFNPAESIGVGTATGVGIGTTVTFSNPGAGVTQRFVPKQSIYYPDHGLNANDKIYYAVNGGSTITVWNGLSGFSTQTDLTDYDFLYSYPITPNLLGISTTKVGLGTTGGYEGVGVGSTTSGLLYFTDAGSGVRHSFETSLRDVVTAQVDKSVVTVSTAATHGMALSDKIWVTLKPNTTGIVTVKYNTFNRRMVFNPVTFTSSDVSVTWDTITINNHDFVKGDRVVHTAVVPSGGLSNEGMYYVIPYTAHKIRLVSEEFELDSNNPSFVNITSASGGTLSKINPLVEFTKNQKVKFDLGDSSLAFNNNGIDYSAFSMNLYSDSKFSSEFFTPGNNVAFAVTVTGSPGVDSTANLTLSLNDDMPKNLWYKFDLDNVNLVDEIRKSMIVDESVESYSQINVVDSKYDGEYFISGIGTTTFTYEIPEAPSTTTYNSDNSKLSYETNSKTAYGSITKFWISDKGSGYRSLPGITSITSGFGTGAIITGDSDNIGSILQTRFKGNGIGWDYPSDKTLRPSANLPEILKIKSLTSFDTIGISSVGVNYLIAPKLVVIDNFTKKRIEEVDLEYKLGDSQVTILTNTTGMYNVSPRIIPIDNSNGVGISSLTYTDKTVRIYFDTTFSDASDFPFAVGEEIFVENISVGVGSTASGYNSADYDYKFFSPTTAEGQIGGSGAYIEYSLDGLIGAGKTPGSPTVTIGKVIPVKHFPIFEPTLKTNDFLKGETVISGSGRGVVESWNSSIERLKVDSPDDLEVGDTVKGLTSNTQGVIESKTEFNSEFIIGAGATVVDGWQRNTGFLNDSLQRLPNNEYYQNFSYSLKSEISQDTWDDPVSALNHTAGFDKYSDLQIISKAEDPAIVSVDDADLTTITDIVGEGTLHSFPDFDLVTEETVEVSTRFLSNKINFENKILTDYYQSVGNRVLQIDDISGQFYSNESKTDYAKVATFSVHDVWNKSIVLVKDAKYTDEKQLAIVNTLQHNAVGYQNQYAFQETYPELGTFDYLKSATGWDLTFHPTKYEYNNYQVSTFSFSIVDNVSAVESYTLGDVVEISGQNNSVAAGSSDNVVSISTAYRAATVMIMLENTDQVFQGSQINVVHDGTNVYMTEYNNIETNLSGSFDAFGTYHAYISGSNVKIDFDSNVSVALTANSQIVAIADTGSGTGIGTTNMSTAKVSSDYVSIASTTSPSAVSISTYSNATWDSITSGYYVLCFANTTDYEYQMAEVAILNSDSNESMVEWGDVKTGSNIGTVGITSDGDYINLTFTPKAGVDVQVRALSIEQYIFNENSYSTDLEFKNQNVHTDYNTYTGTKSNLREDFGLKKGGLEIFRRQFDGNDTSIANTSTNKIELGDHFFVTGELVKYSYDGTGTTNAIGIAETSVVGVGTTSKLPEELYVVKVGGGAVRFTDTAEKALAENPSVFEITSVGIGTSHHMTAVDANKRTLVAIDNIIQSPICRTEVTTGLSTSIVWDTNIRVTEGIGSFFAGDLAKMNDEIVQVDHVGFGGTDVMTVKRGEMGTQIKSHDAGATIRKLSGTYNIVGNEIFFAGAPHGSIPLSDATAADPDNRDWVGITTSSTFQGRVFMRTSPVGASNSAYTENYVFDDISEQFTGLTSEFTLTHDTANTVGFSTWNGIVLVNNIFQQPSGDQGEDDAYSMEQTGAASTITFTGAGSTGYNPNGGNWPVGGVIVSVGSTEGFGYQPLVAAGGTATISAGGTITSIGLGNTGSGYREAHQPTVNVAIQTFSGGVANVTNIGTAAISEGHIVSIAVTSGHRFYKPRWISNVGYSSVTGVTTVTTLLPHGLSQGDDITLSGIAFTCDYSSPKTITGVAYSAASGIMTVTTSGAHGYSVDKDVIFTGIGMTCDIDAGVTTHYYPRGRDLAYDNAISIASTTATTITVDIGLGSKNDQYEHRFVSAATSAITAGGDYAHRYEGSTRGCVITGGDYAHTFVDVAAGAVTVSGGSSMTPTWASYDPVTGNFVIEKADHGLTTEDSVTITDDSFQFTCEMDDNGTEKSYPRSTDPISGEAKDIIAYTQNTFTINVGVSTIVRRDIVGASYTGSTGELILDMGTTDHGLTTHHSVKIASDSLTFSCAMDDYETLHTYPRSTDPYYDTAISIASTTANTITLNVGTSTAVSYDISTAVYTGSTGILTMTIGSHHLSDGQSIKIATGIITMTCSRDDHLTKHSYPRKPDPYYNGVGITSVPSTTQFVVNVGTSTVPTFYSSGGTVQGCIIAPRSSGSTSSGGHDPAFQSTDVIRIIDNKNFEVNTGTTTCDHFYARGGTIKYPMEVVFDDPLSYDNIPLIYSSESATGTGHSATADIVVGQGSSVISFTVDQEGYGYGNGEILTVAIGGDAGIPTDTTKTYKEFQLTVEEIYTDSFNAWSVGELEVLDRMDGDFDGQQKSFNLSINSVPVSIQAKKGSNVDVQMVLLVFINDILQEPGVSYTFNGGSTVYFTTPPKAGSTSKILFYKGSGSIDVTFTDILETVKVGDTLQIENDVWESQGVGLRQNPRVVTGISTIDSVNTGAYPGPGVTTDNSLTRPVVWTKQEVDRIINTQPIGKDRIHYEPWIYPSACMLHDVGVTTTVVYVNDVRPYFNPVNESNTRSFQNTVLLESQDTITGAAATALVSTGGTVSSIDVTVAGVGYTAAPEVAIGNIIGVGSTGGRATATATISGGEVTAITVSSGGTSVGAGADGTGNYNTLGIAYTSTNPPLVIVGPPKLIREKVTVSSFAGDYGVIVGVGTTVSGSQNQIYFDTFIPKDSFMRDTDYVDSAVEVSGISTGDYLTIFNTNISIGDTFGTQTSAGAPIGIGTSCLDAVYQVSSYEDNDLENVENGSTTGFTTECRRIFCNVDTVGTGIGYTTAPDMGDYSWGKLTLDSRPGGRSFNFYGENGLTGINTSGKVTRYEPLKYNNYV